MYYFFPAIPLTVSSIVFSVPTRTHAAYQLKALKNNVRKYVFRMDVEPMEPLYHYEGEKTALPVGAAA